MQKVLVIDAQGGGIGKQLIAEIINRNLNVELIAIGTNATATAQMIKAGASRGATGENPVIVGCRNADFIIGPIGIAVADSMLGEITPHMAAAVGSSPAKRIFIPINTCGNYVVGIVNKGIKAYIAEAVDFLQASLDNK